MGFDVRCFDLHMCKDRRSTSYIFDMCDCAKGLLNILCYQNVHTARNIKKKSEAHMSPDAAQLTTLEPEEVISN